jgi:GNAT superfamily N-acetyltransferase
MSPSGGAAGYTGAAGETMTEAQILEALAELGVAPHLWRVVLLLPMVQIAWADAAIQLNERERILAIAQAAGLADGEAGEVLTRWLSERPSRAELATGRRVLVALAYRQRGIGAELDVGELERVIELCLDVARSAGGLFDTVFTVSREERAALVEITRELRSGAEQLRDLLPGSNAGALEDL